VNFFGFDLHSAGRRVIFCVEKNENDPINDSERAAMKERVFTVMNKAGIHCRPSSVILNTINKEFPYHTFTVETGDGQETELNSILTLISLGLTVGSKAVLKVEGPDEEKAVQRIGDLFENEFDFPPR
jgi:phosphocarrier protein